MKIKDKTDAEIWHLYAEAKNTLIDRKLVRTRNIVGERGEQLAIDYYSGNPDLPNMQSVSNNTAYIDAISIKGERYSIKTISHPHKGRINNTTSAFYGFEPLDSEIKDTKRFEYLIVVIIDKFLQPIKIIEISWELFLEYKIWKSGIKAWNVTITNKLLNKSKIVFDVDLLRKTKIK